MLEQTLEILRPIIPESSQLVKNETKGTDAILPHEQARDKKSPFPITNNMFASLDLEDVTDDGPKEPATEKVSAPSGVGAAKQAKPVVYNVEKTNEDLDFAIFCLLSDLHRVEDFLTELWSQYHDNKPGARLDLMTVSVTTNIAVGLVREAEQSFLDEYPQAGTNLEYLELYYKRLCKLRGQGLVYLGQDTGPIARHVFATPLTFLQMLSKYVQHHGGGRFTLPVEISRCEGELFGPYDPGRDRSRTHSSDQEASKLEAATQAFEDRYVLAKLFREVFVIGVNCGSSTDSILPVADEMTRGINELTIVRHFTLYAVFAGQIYLNIYHIMRENISRGFLDLRFTALCLEKCTHPTSHAWKVMDTWIKRDILSEKKEMMKYVLGEPHAFMKQHPWWCGLMVFGLNLKLQQSSCSADVWRSSIMSAAHLYNAARQEGLLPRGEQDWQDMDFILQYHGPEQIFRGTAPDKPEKYFQCWERRSGVSLVNWARNRRDDRRILSKTGCSMLTLNTPIHYLFSGHDPYHPLLDTKAGNLKQYLNQAYRYIQSQKDGGKAAKQWNNNHELSFVELLEFVRESMIGQEPRLLFGYGTMYLRCFELHYKLRTFLQDTFRAHRAWEEEFDLRDMSEECAFVHLPRRILYAYSFAVASRVDVDAAIIVGAAEVIRNVIREEDQVEMKKVRALSRSNIVQFSNLSASDWKLHPSTKEEVYRRAARAAKTGDSTKAYPN